MIVRKMCIAPGALLHLVAGGSACEKLQNSYAPFGAASNHNPMNVYTTINAASGA